jgi:hypothetical protein
LVEGVGVVKKNIVYETEEDPNVDEIHKQFAKKVHSLLISPSN